MAISVVNKRTYNGRGIYIGRGSLWENLFTHLPLENTKARYQVSTRRESIDCYRIYLHLRFIFDPTFHEQLLRLHERYRSGEGLVFICYCKPKPCHGDILKEFIENL